MSDQVRQVVRQTDSIEVPLSCYHCGDPCGDGAIREDGRSFCCSGCQTVYSLLYEHGLGTYYTLESGPGLKPDQAHRVDRFAYLDRDGVRSRLLDFDDGRTARVTFSVPQVHCSSCIWLLENLYRLHESILSSRVDFQRRRVSLSFDIEKLPLSRLVGLLASLGYEPEISLSDLDRKQPDRSYRPLYARLAVAGFCLGNVMLLSFPRYLGLEGTTETAVSRLFDYLKILLAVPVFFYSAVEFFKPALSALRHRRVNMDVPIALGIVVLFVRSTYDILLLNGAGYIDSLCALVFLLLVGRLYQMKTYFSLAFDRSYRSYLPIAVMKKTVFGEASVPLEEIKAGDIIVLRNREIIPADGILLSGQAEIDYSFVTGESATVRAESGDLVYAGGRQCGSTIEVEVTREPSRSYLLQLWEETEAVVRQKPTLATLANRMSYYFTPAVLALASLTGIYWWFADRSLVWSAATSVLIVACPCALALASPIALGTAQRLMGKARFFVKDSDVVERIASVTALVFDKTGTITQSGAAEPDYVGRPPSNIEQAMIYSVVRQSTHPLSVQLRDLLAGQQALPTIDFSEQPGRGIRAVVGAHSIKVGSADYVNADAAPDAQPNVVYVSIDDAVLGFYRFANRFRPGLKEVATRLVERFRLSLVSGDHEGDRSRVSDVLGPCADLHFNQSPSDKLQFVNQKIQAGERVVMVGDGLNDAGGLNAATVGLTVVEDDSSFSPSSDGVLSARSFRQLPQFIALAHDTVTVIKLSFALSLLYNLVGLWFAVQGLLSPVLAAVLMPASSVTVVLFSTLATGYFAHRRGIL